jgi:hypothetical protein
MTQVQAVIRSSRVHATFISVLSLVAVVLAGGAGTKWT